MSDALELTPTELLKDGWLVQDQVYAPDWWVARYWNSTDGSHRDTIIQALEALGPFSSVLEIGCNAGPNLRRIHARWPAVTLAGTDIHPGALRYGTAQAHAEGWRWAGIEADLRDLPHLGLVADVVLTCYALAYLDPRDIDAVLAAALACARVALVICEPGAGGPEEAYVPPGPHNVAEYHFDYRGRVAGLPGPHRVAGTTPIDPPHARLTHVLTVLK